MYRLSSLLSHDNFIPVSKVLASKIGLLEATLFGELCAESDYWHERGEVTEDDYFFSTIENIENKLFIKRKTQERLIRTLVNIGLISISKRGLPAKRYIKINEELLAKQLVQNDPSSRDKMDKLVGLKNTTNKTIKNKTIKNNISSKKFIPPTLEEVQQFIDKRQSPIDAKYFIDYYSENDWKDNNNKPIKNWKLKLITWEMREKKNKSSCRDSSIPVERQCDWSDTRELFDEYYREKEINNDY